jgi:hypothetical protein
MGDVALDVGLVDPIDDRKKPVLKKELADLSVATKEDVISLEVATLTEYSRSENANGEAVLSAVFGGQTIVQTLPISGQGFLMFDAESLCWTFVPMQVPDGLTLVEVLT